MTSMGENNILSIPRDFALVWLIPPTLYDCELNDPESIRVFLEKSTIRICSDKHEEFIRDLKVIHRLWPECMRLIEDRARDTVQFKFVGRFRHHLYRAYLLSRLARSKKPY